MKVWLEYKKRIMIIRDESSQSTQFVKRGRDYKELFTDCKIGQYNIIFLYLGEKDGFAAGT